MMTTTELIHVSCDNAVATLTLNRPEKRNALNADLWRGLAAELHRLSARADLRCLVLRGAGGHFAAGADMAEFAQLRATPAGARAYGEIMLAALWALRDFPVPTIARVEGNCMGGGLEVAAMCDLRVAAEDAKFGIPIQKVGITMPYPELAALVDLLGRPTMLELLLTGEVFDSAWAQQKGLVTRVVPVSELEDAVAALAARIAAGAPISHRNHKKFTRRCLEPQPLTDAEIAQGYAAVDSADYREGIAAFLGKRPPQFVGN
ncbi:enoyl-CoA hydratase/isomerase family protein [Dongia rigui]|uniref:Enoyl-CoA hydratase-related protein n=1 Tax=Dongia rigui TaxID=940149 RepID=A0ABU5E370_9PROT|nr:enoyl-CoA hydratase-related protein [Dongia rigui]MDY0873620.1 enoyl-CoA hydratase-related protein [Dongia rigui]